MSALAAALIALAAVGFLDSLYFFLVTYGWMRPDPRWLPNFCRIDEQSCARIVDTRYGRLFLVPNSVLGLAWYGLLALWGGAELAGLEVPYASWFFPASLYVLGVTVFLAWALLARLKVVCTLCFVAHAINAAVPVILWLLRP